MQTLLEVLFSIIFEGILWSVGAIAKKLTGQPISASGTSEQFLGFVIILVLVVLAIWWAHRV